MFVDREARTLAGGRRCWVVAVLIAISTLGCRPRSRAVKPYDGRLTAPQILRTCPGTPVTPRPWTDERIDEDLAGVSLAFLSERSRRTLETLGLRSAMARLVVARARVEVEGDAALIDLVHAKQVLTARINLVDLEIATVAAEADCHEELAGWLAGSLRDRKEARVRWYTVAAISVGALFGITSGALAVAELEPASGAVAIAGGVAEAGLGFGILATRGSAVQLPIDRNLLHDVWEGPDEPRHFPPSVWGLLQTPRGEGRLSPREELATRWRQSPQLGRSDSARGRERIALLFSPAGGAYDIAALELRMELLDQLEAELNLLSADLHELLREILVLDAK